MGWLTRKEFVHGVVATLIGTVLGFLFAVGWDLWKDWRKENREQERAKRLVADEINTNITLLESMRSFLKKDSEAAKEGKLFIEALPTLAVEAWQATRLAGTFSPSAWDIAKEIGSTYHKISILNHRIQARELFKVTSQALSNFNDQRAQMNEDILRLSDEILERMKNHREVLLAP